MSATTEKDRSTSTSSSVNLGRIEEIQGVVIEAMFPDKLPEINHAIRVKRPAAAAEEDEDIAAPDDAGSSARSSSISATTACARSRWTRPTASRAAPMSIDTGAPITCRSAGHAREDLQPARRADRPRRGDPGRRRALADPPRRADRRGADADDGDVRDRHQGDRSARARTQGRQGRPVRRRRRGQDGHHPGADPQPRSGARRPVGVLRRRRALARGQRPLARDEGIRASSTRRCSCSAR